MLDHLASFTIDKYETEDEYPEILDRKIALIEG